MAQVGFSLLGIAVLLAIAFALSDNRKAIKWRTVGGAFALQAGLGAFVLYVPFGQTVLNALSNGVQAVINFGNEGIAFLFGGLVSANTPVGFVFALKVLPMIIFFSAFISVLYYLGVMKVVINFLGGAVRAILGTSRTESLSATANIFVGQTEAPMLVKPYIAHMSQSELFAIMVGGVASIAGSVMAGFAGLGVELKYLIAASFMAAPGGLLMAKMLKPETEETTDTKEDLMSATEEAKPANVIDAAAQGASSGLSLATNVGAMLLAFVALIALLNGMLDGIGEFFGMDNLSMQMILGYVFAPLAWILGIPASEVLTAGSLIGQKLVLNEFVAYIDFVNVKESLSTHSQAIITFALCGFANLSSIAILLGGVGSMAPNRRGDIASMGIRAVIAGSLSNLMSAALAGLFLAL